MIPWAVALHAYGIATVKDIPVDSLDNWEDLPKETDGTARGNQTLPTFPSTPPFSSSIATCHAWGHGSGTTFPGSPVAAIDLNASTPASPTHAFV
jgi:hypothetical protein